MVPLLRRAVVLLVVIAGITSALKSAALADDANSITVRLDFLPAGHHAPFFLPLAKGWFKNAGLDVTVIDGTGSGTAVQLAASGQVDICDAALPVMAFARDKGLPVTSVAVLFRKGDVGLIVPRESPIHTTKDLAGKVLAFSAGGFEGPFIDAFLATGGFTRDQVHLLNIDAASKTAYEIAGTADGVFASPPIQLPLIMAQRPSRAVTFWDAGLEMPGYGLVTSTDTLRAKGPAIRKFASIAMGAWAYILAGHEDEAARAVVAERPQARINEAVVAEQIRESRDFTFTPDTMNLPMGTQTDAEWVKTLSILEQAKTIRPGTHPGDYYTNRYLDPAVIAAVSHGKG